VKVAVVVGNASVGAVIWMLPFASSVRVTPFVRVTGVPAATPLMAVTCSWPPSRSLSFASRRSAPKIALAALETYQISPFAVGPSLTALTVTVTVAVAVPPWPSLTE
jgi:hypothetical protein